MRTFFLFFLLILSGYVFAQLTPEVTSWIINSTGETGYGGIETNVQQVQYSDNYVYVSCTCIPGYDIGPWPGNPNIPSNQNFVFKIPRHPVPNTGTLTETPLGHIGVWTNGVSIFNAKDAMSYNNMGIWNQNAIIVEGSSFDDCLGHPSPTGEYHHHLNPTCLYDDEDSLTHSPVIGFAFDGYPVYGAYGNANTDGSGSVRRMRSSYIMRSISDRTTLPDGTTLTASQYGPAINATYPLGYYIEDFEYIDGSGDLDEHNGRFCVTPEYPEGTYAYFVTLDVDHVACYPYTLGPTYYGTVTTDDIGPGSGHVSVSESVETYTDIYDPEEESIQFTIYPDPATDYIAVFADPSTNNNMTAFITDGYGHKISEMINIQPAVNYYFDLKNLSAGIYYLELQSENSMTVKQFIRL